MPSHPDYPFKEWLDGRTWLITPGEDFAVKPQTIYQAAQRYAKRHGIGLTIRTVRSTGQLVFRSRLSVSG